MGKEQGGAFRWRRRGTTARLANQSHCRARGAQVPIRPPRWVALRTSAGGMDRWRQMVSFPTVSVEQMREVDRIMVEGPRIELLQMMENAGRALAPGRCSAATRSAAG